MLIVAEMITPNPGLVTGLNISKDFKPSYHMAPEALRATMRIET